MTPTGIANLALSHIGHRANISSIDPPEDSMEAALCATFYPIARDVLLEWHTWAFNTKRKALAELTTNESDRWAFAYGLPIDCSQPVSILLAETAATLPVVWTEQAWGLWLGSPEMRQFDFLVETTSTGEKALYTNVEGAILLYKAKVTDSSKWSATFCLALSYQLASYIAGPITKDPRIGVAMAQAAQSMSGQAADLDSNARELNPYRDMPSAAQLARL